MTTLTSSRGISFRTRPMTETKAQTFAQCLAANPTFVNVDTIPSRSAGKFVVVYQCASESRRAELLQGQQDARLVRAAEQAHGYVFVRGEGFDWCFKLEDDCDPYQVSDRECTCRDFHWRCEENGLKCKHQQMRHHGFCEVLAA